MSKLFANIDNSIEINILWYWINSERWYLHVCDSESLFPIVKVSWKNATIEHQYQAFLHYERMYGEDSYKANRVKNAFSQELKFLLL